MAAVQEVGSEQSIEELEQELFLTYWEPTCESCATIIADNEIAHIWLDNVVTCDECGGPDR